MPASATGTIRHVGGATMGTTWAVQFAHDSADERIVERAIRNELDSIVEEMSPWVSHSAINAFNRAAPDTWHTLPRRTTEVFRLARDVATDSGGAFNPAMAAASEAWGFGPSDPVTLPDPAKRADLARGADTWRALKYDQASGMILQPGGAALDFCGIAKGYAVDRLGMILQVLGIDHFLAEIGGEFVGQGARPDGHPWWVDSEPPPDGAIAGVRVALCGWALATSGNYRRFLLHDGRRLSHTLDPRSGAPSDSGVVSVSVVHPSCAVADALATAIMVMGAEEGMKYANARALGVHLVAENADCGSVEEHVSETMRRWSA